MVEYITDAVQLDEALKYLTQLSTVGFDVESNGLDPLSNHVLLIQVGDEIMQYVFDVYQLGAGIYTMLEALKTEDITKVMHNAKFDYGMIKGNFGIDLPKVVCTMVGEQLLTRGMTRRYNLQTVASKYLGVDIEKGEQMSFVDMQLGDPFTERQIQYSGDDVKHLIPLYKKIQSLLDGRGMQELSELEYETVRVTADLELNGIFLDPKKWNALRDIAQKELDAAEIILDQHFVPVVGQNLFGGANINYNSPKQLTPVLEHLTKRTIESTGVAALERLDHPAVSALLKYREHKKKLTTYGDAFLEKYVSGVDGRIHSNFKQLGADSGRYASTNPNMTNIPRDKRYRAAFTVQDPDYRIVSADFSGQELRLLTHISQEPKFIYALENDMDLHCYSASLLFNIPYDDFFERNPDNSFKMKNGERVRKEDMDEKYRGPAKSITFGLIYGMGPKKLAAAVNIEISEAKRLMDRYFVTFPAIRSTLNKLAREARINKYALSPLDGRRRDLTTFDWDNSREAAHAINIAKNLPFQGAGASVTKLAMCLLKHGLDAQSSDAKIINVVHDEILVEVHKDEAEVTAKMVQDCMIKAFKHYAPSVEMVVSPDIDTCWVH